MSYGWYLLLYLIIPIVRLSSTWKDYAPIALFRMEVSCEFIVLKYLSNILNRWSRQEWRELKSSSAIIDHETIHTYGFSFIVTIKNPAPFFWQI